MRHNYFWNYENYENNTAAMIALDKNEITEEEYDAMIEMAQQDQNTVYETKPQQRKNAFLWLEN